MLSPDAQAAMERARDRIQAVLDGLASELRSAVDNEDAPDLAGGAWVIKSWVLCIEWIDVASDDDATSYLQRLRSIGTTHAHATGILYQLLEL